MNIYEIKSQITLYNEGRDVNEDFSLIISSIPKEKRQEYIKKMEDHADNVISIQKKLRRII